jgi:isopentenyl diphosphate isomerase/L-lactate dehydrogenase-like FMN-dependent dehydrogenase
LAAYFNLADRKPMSPAATAINLLDYEQLARDKLPRMIFDYFAGGADDGITLRENSAAYDRIRLHPHALVNVSQRNMQINLLGQTIPSPIIIAPMALTAMAHPTAELAIAQAAGGTPLTLSTLSSFSIEEVAQAAAGPLWFQLYVFRNRDITHALVKRAEAAGYKALVVTVDAPIAGNQISRWKMCLTQSADQASPPFLVHRLTRRCHGMTSTGCAASRICRFCSRESCARMMPNAPSIMAQPG